MKTVKASLALRAALFSAAAAACLGLQGCDTIMDRALAYAEEWAANKADDAINGALASEEEMLEKASFATGIVYEKLFIVENSVSSANGEIRYQVQTADGGLWSCYYVAYAGQASSDALCTMFAEPGNTVKKKKSSSGSGSSAKSSSGSSSGSGSSSKSGTCNDLLRAAGRC